MYPGYFLMDDKLIHTNVGILAVFLSSCHLEHIYFFLYFIGHGKIGKGVF